MDKDYSLFVHLLGFGRQQVAQQDSYPAGGAYRTRDLEPGQAFVYTHRF